MLVGYLASLNAKERLITLLEIFGEGNISFEYYLISHADFKPTPINKKLLMSAARVKHLNELVYPVVLQTREDVVESGELYLPSLSVNLGSGLVYYEGL